jgi:hypothetical protein
MNNSKHVRLPKGRFWHFIRTFWQPHGGYDMCDEWYATGGWYADLSPSKFSNFKTSYPYHLELYRHKKSYSLTVEINFGNHQKQTITRINKISSQKEAIRQSLKVIKEFECSPKAKEVWLKIRHKIPIIKDDSSSAMWVATSIIGSPSSSLYYGNCYTGSSSAPLGYGDFYTISKYKDFRDNDKLKWSFCKYSIQGYGYSSQGTKSIPFHVLTSLKGFDEELDEIIVKALSFKRNSKFVMIEDQQMGLHKAQQFIDIFYVNQ